MLTTEPFHGVGGRAGAGAAAPNRRSRMRGSPGQASSRTARGTRRAAYRNARATTTTSSRGPITGRNSGIKSIGDSTHSPAISTTTLQRRGTWGFLRSRRTVVTQSGRNDANSFSVPSGRCRPRTIMTIQLATITATTTPAPVSNSRIPILELLRLVQPGVHGVGVVLEHRPAPPQSIGRLHGGVQAEHVTALQVAVPAAQPIQALLLLLQLGQGELGRPHLLGDLLLVLAAVCVELVPLLQPDLQERLPQRGLRLLVLGV